MRTRVALIVVAVCLSAPWPTLAQQQAGIRVGVSGDPDQFVFGGHLETSPLVDRLVFRPTGEIGLGDSLVVVALNFEFAYKVPLDAPAWTAYFGGGPALNILSRDGNRRRRNSDDTSLEGGFNIMVGIEHQGGLFTEFKVGALDSPDVKLLVGFSF